MLFRTSLVLATAAVVLGARAPDAHAQPPSPDQLSTLDRRLAHSPRVHILTLAGIIEAAGVRATPEGLTFRVVDSTPTDTLQGAGTLAWDRVLGVEVQGTKAGSVAFATGATLGIVGLLIGFAGGVASPEGEVGRWAFSGAAIGALGGAALGGVMGSTMRAWVRVYPATSSSGGLPGPVATALDTITSAPVRLVAIAPLANFTKRKRAVREGEDIRAGIVRELALRSDRHTAAVQALDETDRILREASYTAEAAARLPAGELCRLLGTDAVLMGAITKYRTMGTASTVTSLLFLNVGAKGRRVEADLAIFEGVAGKAVWRKHVRGTSGLLSSSAMIGSVIGDIVSDDFPYARPPVGRGSRK